jgi:lysophospholipase L1-like esterase
MTTALRILGLALLGLAGPLDLAGAGEAPRATAVPAGSHYVALGSSFAAGPGITQPADVPGTRCARSADNYAHQLARRRGLELTDVSCSGATTQHLLAAWNELPPQLDALRPDTRLVTVTIGGNDLGYMAGLIGASCHALQPEAACRGVPAPSERDYAGVAERLQRIAVQVHRRSPQARLVFVDYVTVLPPAGGCALTPLPEADAETARAIDARLRQITATVARGNGAQLLEASRVTRAHHACAAEPWINGYAKPDAAAPQAFYHPKLAGMTAVAEALDQALGR